MSWWWSGGGGGGGAGGGACLQSRSWSWKAVQRRSRSSAGSSRTALSTAIDSLARLLSRVSTFSLQPPRCFRGGRMSAGTRTVLPLLGRSSCSLRLSELAAAPVCRTSGLARRDSGVLRRVLTGLPRRVWTGLPRKGPSVAAVTSASSASAWIAAACSSICHGGALATASAHSAVSF